MNRNTGSFFGLVAATTTSVAIADVTVPPPYSWRD
jgi:hypothetical protein